ncbi:hypothetical protein VTI74DRAFT_4080 [Chaetomium olivicolor]
MAAVMQKFGDEPQIAETVVDDSRDDKQATNYETATVLNSFPGPACNRAHVTQFSFSLDAKLDLERLRAAVDRTAQWFSTLRIRIVRHSASRKLVQVALVNGASASWSCFVAGDIQHVLQMDWRATPGLGNPLHRISIVHSA